VPTSTDAQIEEIIAAIRDLCHGPFRPEAEVELRELARQLRIAIRRHVGMAKSSLTAKKLAIVDCIPKEGDRNLSDHDCLPG
jgi:hypothetical protein